ncbi:AIM24 family protein [Pseudonocardia acidicola]|uniref:AIM24 family protein n=1 Tax=Pseudonocardia acidicola TaxID=2724939 RepID=A0ABX1S378_9PSEU|nr:AIM24 family protein [Pseudonocardia acidicola]NMH96025.1 AIM24 family protein [Pseudonocardia acidicola]
MRSNLFEQQHAEVATTQRFTLQSSKMLKVLLGPDLLALKGSMVAYQGRVEFHHEGAGSMGKLVKRLVSSEDTPLMRVRGQGEVFFAHRAQNIFLVGLEGDAISVNGTNLLAFDAELSWDVRRVKGAGMATGGLFTTEIGGEGTVALTSDGEPLLLDCSQQPTCVDVQAAVAWSAGLVPQVVSSMNMRSLLRGGSGEALQYAFHGPGFVVVQPSEGVPVATGQGS